MPSNFLPVRFSDFQRWIPEEDIDGVDAGTKFLSEQINVDLEEGFIKPAFAPVAGSLPSNVATAVASNYNIISAKTFTHSVRGTCTFYVLYKYTGGVYYYSFYVVDSNYPNGLSLNIDEMASNVTFNGASSNVNYDFVNDQLKINLNTTVTYNSITQTPIMNLTLIYMSSRIYRAGLSRAEGWFLFPRWLGWTYNPSTSILIKNEATYNNNYTEDFEDASYTPGLAFDAAWTRGSHPTGGVIIGTASLWYQATSSPETTTTITLSRITALKKISFYIKSNYIGQICYLRVRDQSLNIIYEDNYTTVKTLELVVFDNIVLTDNYTYLYVEIYFDLTMMSGYVALPYMIIDDLCYQAYDDTVVVAQYFDGQRALVSTAIDFSVYREAGRIDNSLSIKEASIDWRIYAFEIYVKVNSLYYLWATFVVDNTWSAGSTGYTLHTFDNYDVESAVTLNFNYGLGGTVRVDNQINIYSETSYRNRTYCVNGGFRVYQTQIAGNARHQPDSFPYSETDFYGFFELPRSESARAVMVTPLEELLVLTTSKAYIYYMQIAQGTAYKRTKVINGNAGINCIKSLAKDLSGNPNGSIIAWADNNGIYAHSGGIDAPVDLTVKANIKNWWLRQGIDTSTFYKTNLITFYYPHKNQIWFADGKSGGSKTVLIYEVDYGRFKKYTFNFEIIEFLGVSDNKLYMLSSTNTIYYYTDEIALASTRLSPNVTTHYTTGFRTSQAGQLHPLGADEYKVLQELFLNNNVVDTDASRDIWIIFPIVNEVSYSNIYMKANVYYDHCLTPLNISFNKIKFQITTEPFTHPETRASLREFGFTFSTFDRGLNQ